MARVLMIGLDAASLDFIDSSRASLKPTADLLYCEPFWCDLERRGYRVVALDVPCTWRSRLERGVEVTDWATHEPMQGFTTHPRELESEIRQHFGGRSLGPEIPVQKTQTQLGHLRDEVLASIAKKAALVTWLLKPQAWDFFIAVFGETHRAGHLFWPVEDADAGATNAPGHALLDCYDAVDRALGDIMQIALDEETVFVLFSVHGMGTNRSQEHFTRPIMDRINERFAKTAGLNGGAPPPRSVMRVLRERLPPRLQHAVGRAVPHRWKDAVVNRAMTGGYDWEHTPGLALLGSVTGFVRVNLRGREAAGILEPGSELHRRYLRFVDHAFHTWRFVDTGQPLTREVVLTSEQCPGKRSDYLPDAVVCWDERASASRIGSDELGTIDLKPSTGRNGNHRPDAFTVVLDSRYPHGDALAHGDIADLAPMVARLLARPA